MARRTLASSGNFYVWVERNPPMPSNSMDIVLIACGGVTASYRECLATGAAGNIKQLALLLSRLRRMSRRFKPVDPDGQALIVRILILFTPIYAAPRNTLLLKLNPTFGKTRGGQQSEAAHCGAFLCLDLAPIGPLA
jgi:hypothetical protein